MNLLVILCTVKLLDKFAAPLWFCLHLAEVAKSANCDEPIGVVHQGWSTISRDGWREL